MITNRYNCDRIMAGVKRMALYDIYVIIVPLSYIYQQLQHETFNALSFLL